MNRTRHHYVGVKQQKKIVPLITMEKKSLDLDLEKLNLFPRNQIGGSDIWTIRYDRFPSIN